MSDETIGSAIERLTKERAQARIDLKRIDTLVQELGECLGRLSASLDPNAGLAEDPERVVSGVGAELTPYLNIEKIRELIQSRAKLRRTIESCTSKINGYTGE